MEPNIKTAHILPLDALAGPAPAAGLVGSPAAAAVERDQLVRRTKLDERLAGVLRAAVEGFACDGAELYTLNDTTSELLLRSAHHLGERESGEPCRPLAKALADVAAMAGSAIVLEDDEQLAEWPVPVWCGSAVCLPVASDTTVFGTLWIYSSGPRPFADAEVQLIEVVAGRLAVELELDRLRCGLTPAASVPSAARAAATERENNPAGVRPAGALVSPMLDEWELAGWNIPEEPRMAYHDWQALADGRTLVVAGAAQHGTRNPGSLLQAARACARSHAADSRDAGELLTKVNQALWMASPGGEGLAMTIAILDEEGTHATLASAGSAGALRWRASTCDAIPATCPAAGWSEQTIYLPRHFEVIVRERLVLWATSDKLAAPKSLEKLGHGLRSRSTDGLRTMTAKQALRKILTTADAIATPIDSAVLIRRR